MMNKAAAHSKHEYQKWYMMNAELPRRLELLLTEPIWPGDFTDWPDNWHDSKSRQHESSGSQTVMSELSPFWCSFMFIAPSTHWYPVTIPSCPQGLDFQGIKYNETNLHIYDHEWNYLLRCKSETYQPSTVQLFYDISESCQLPFATENNSLLHLLCAS